MLKKLLKHELKATGRYMWIILLAIILLMIGGAVSALFLGRNLLELEDAPPVVGFIMIMCFGFWILGLIAGSILTIVMNVYRFYKNFLTDEGYLMFTLPVNVHQLVWSKLLVAMMWSVLTTILIFAGIFLAVNNLVSGVSAIAPELFGSPGQIYVEMFGLQDLNMPVLAVLGFFVLVASSAAGVLEFYTAMSIGYGFQKNKGLWSVVMYFAISTILSIISSAFNVVTMLMDGDGSAGAFVSELTGTQIGALFLLGIVVAYAALSVVLYFITTWNLRKRLNLA